MAMQWDCILGYMMICYEKVTKAQIAGLAVYHSEEAFCQELVSQMGPIPTFGDL